MPEEGSKPRAGDAALRAHRSDWFAEVTATVATAISSLGLAIALAALIFTGPLETGLSRATTKFVLVGAVAGLIIGVRGRFRPTISIVQDGPADLLAELASRSASLSEHLSKALR